jgi:hypothetical protein
VSSTEHPFTATTQHLSPVEQGIVDHLGRPWQEPDLTEASLEQAYRTWADLRRIAGFRNRAGGWLTTGKTNPKMGKIGLPTLGVTLHAARRAAAVWSSLEPSDQSAVASALGVTIEDVSRTVNRTVCPRSSAGCRAVCVTAFSANSRFRSADLTRLNRTLLCLLRPDLAFALTGEALRDTATRHRSECRWRVNISDDVRWELVAPGLFRFGVPAYTYTKWSPTERPSFSGFSVVYSATERHDDAQIGRWVDEGHRVAVVLDVPRKKVPTTWRGMPVSDGDVTDDLFAHPAGSVVGLAAKGPDRSLVAQMRESGFARSA